MDQAAKLRNIVKDNNAVKKNNSRIIAVTSGKGGVGKTSVSVNLAIQFRLQGKSVIIFDADFGLANIEVMFGAVPKYNLTDLVYRGKELKDIIIKGPMEIGFISGGSGITSFRDMNKDQLMYLIYKIKELEEMADIIIIDTGAGISSSVLDFLTISNEILLVTTPEPTSITDSYSLLKALNKHSEFDKLNTSVKIIANRVESREEGENLFGKLKVVADKFLNVNLLYLGMIKQDKNMSKSVVLQKPLCIAYPNSEAAYNFKNLSDNLLECRDEEQSSKKKGLVYLFAKKIKKSIGGG